MPRFVGHYIGISFQAELLVMTLLGLLNSTLEWRPFDWSKQIEKIWNLSLTQQYLIFYTDFEYWIKTTNSAYIWYAIACSYIQLRKIEKIRKIRKVLKAKYSITHDLFSSNESNMEISKESSFGSSSGRHHMSLPNLNDAFYRSIFNDCSDNKIFRSLTTLMTVSSFESDDTEEVISQIIRNDNLTPADKCMKLLGLTDVDVISARARVRKRILENTRMNKIEEEYAKKNEIEQIDPLKDYRIKDPFNIDYLMTKTSMCKSQTNDNQIEKTFREVKRKGGEFFKPTEPYKTQKIDEKIDDIKTKDELIVELPIKAVAFTQHKESNTVILLDCIDEKEQINFEFVKNKKKNQKVCPLMRDKIKSRPCFPFVWNRQLKECPFKEQTILSDFIFPSFLNTKDKSSGEVYCTTNREIDNIRNDNKIPVENTISLDNRTLSKNNTTITNFDQQENTKINCNIFSQSQMTSAEDFIHTELEDNDVLKEANIRTTNSVKDTSETLHLEMRRNYNYISNDRSHILPYTSVFSTMGCLSFCQKFITNPYSRELLIDEILDPRLLFNEKFIKNTNDVYRETLFKSCSSKDLFDRGQIMTQNIMNTELLFKMPEQMTYYTGAEYKFVFNPQVQEKNVGLNLQDQKLITEHRYTSIKSKEEQKNNDPINIYESFWSKIDLNNNADINYDRINIQTTESLDNYKYDNKVNNNYHMDNVYSKFSTNNNLNQLSNIENLIENDVCYKDNIENVPCYCKNWNIMSVEDTSKHEKSNFSEKPSSYSNNIRNESLHRLFNVKNKIVKTSFDNNKNFKYFDQSRHYVELLKTKKKRVTSSRERELLEMKALRAYNEITLLEDKREMEEKKQQEKMETIYSFTDNNKFLTMQIMSCSKAKSKYSQIQREKEIDLSKCNIHQDHFNSYNEIEIRNTNDSFFEYVSNINNEELTKEKENINFLENEPSSSQLPSIQNKDAAIMLNLLDRHGSYWFKQELRRILAIKDSQVHLKYNRPNQVIMKLNLPLRSSENINDSLEFDSNTEKQDISFHFREPFSHQYLQTNLDLNSNRNLRIFNSTESIISKKNVRTNTSNFKDFIEYTENKKIIKGEEEEEIKMINTPKEPEIKKIEKSKVDIASVEKNDAFSSLTNFTSISSSPTTEEDITKSIDNFDHLQVRNMFLHVMDIARDVQSSLRPHGILLGNKSVQEINIASSRLCVDQQRDIVDDITASLVHAAFSYKPEIIIRTFPHDFQSINDERSISFLNNFYNTYRMPLADNESILYANNEMDIYAENTLTLTNDQEMEDDANDLDNILKSSRDSTDTDRIFNFYILVREDEDLPLDLTIRPTSSDNFSENEVIRYDSEVTFNETRTMDIVDPEIDFSWSETIENFDQPSFKVLIAFFSFILALYVEFLRSYFFSSSSDSHNSVYGYRPYEVHSNNIFKTNFSNELIAKKCDTVVSSNLVNVTELVDQLEEQERIGVIDFANEVEKDDQVSIESANPQVSNIRDSFDTMYTRSTVKSENDISFGEGSLMEDFS
ncbi:hypothetical protein M0804_004263 [Polistes exclamans]|nr:hypothetical protein M0804_004263 [Polistes exclamans]